MSGRGASLALLVAALTCRRAAAQPASVEPASARLEPAGAPAPAIVTWWLNSSARGEIYVFLDGADVFLRSEDLRAAGLGAVTGARRELGGVEHVSLASIDPPVTVALDDKEMTLRVEVDPRRLPTTVLDLRADAAPAALVLGERASAFVNYAAHWRFPEGYDGYAELGARRGAYLLYSTAMMDQHSRGRGLSQLTWEDPRRLRRALAGDAITPGDSLAGAALLGGVQLARAFELDPYRAHRPALGQAGVVRSPSTAEVYVNGVLVRREQLPPGPFVATDLPATSGAGETRVVVRDAFGHEETYASSYYLPASLLAPGHAEYSYTLGFRRQQLGRASWDYGGPALVAQHREGLTPWLTGGLRLEAGLTLVSGGVHLAAGTRLGEVTLATAASYSDGGGGAAGALGYGYAGRRLTLGLFARALTARYATVALAAADDRVQRELGGSLGVPLPRRVSLAAQVSHTRARDRGYGQRVALTSSLSLARGVLLSASVSVSRGRSRALEAGAFLGLFVVLGGRTSAGVSQRQDADRRETTAELSRTLQSASDYGYRVQGSLGEEGSARGDARAELQGARGRLGAELSWTGERATGAVGVAGGVVLLGGRAFVTRPVARGFGLIRVPGVAGVRGYVDNQLVGRTDARGDLVVPGLLPYYANRLSISELDLPLATAVPRAELQVAPRTRGGVLAVFPAVRQRAVRGSLVVQGSRALAAYGELRVRRAQGGADSSPVGSEGQFELADLPPGQHRGVLEYAGGSCAVALRVPDGDLPVLDLGEVPCVPSPEARR